MKEDYNRLLKRQIRKMLPDGKIPEGMEDFIAAVDQSYKEYEATQYLRDRAVDLSSEELKVKNRQLREKNELMDSFVYRVSHDLKNPLHNLQSLVHMLNLKLEDHERGPIIEKILSHMDRATSTMLVRIQDLLELSRMDNLIKAKPIKVDLEEEFKMILEEQGPAIEASAAHIHYDFSEVPQMNFVLENMRSILSNFLSNAIKYRHPERIPEIKVLSKRGNEKCALVFQDNGMGMDLERDGKKLFSMFQRLHHHVEGSGVGLFIIHRIVTAVGGKIEVESKVGEGTTFTILFPYTLVPNGGHVTEVKV